MPTSFETETTGWWNACAKLELITARGKADPNFMKAYLAAREDPALSSIDGVSYTQWSGGSQEDKAAARTQIDNVIQDIVARHGLKDLLISAPVDESEIGSRVVALQTATSSQLGISAPSPGSLIEYCPGARGNVSLNTRNPLFPKLIAALERPEVDAAYRSAAAEFTKYLEQHPASTAAERNTKVLELMAPVLQNVQ